MVELTVLVHCWRDSGFVIIGLLSIFNARYTEGGKTNRVMNVRRSTDGRLFYVVVHVTD